MRIRAESLKVVSEINVRSAYNIDDKRKFYSGRGLDDRETAQAMTAHAQGDPVKYERVCPNVTRLSGLGSCARKYVGH